MSFQTLAIRMNISVLIFTRITQSGQGQMIDLSLLMIIHENRLKLILNLYCHTTAFFFANERMTCTTYGAPIVWLLTPRWTQIANGNRFSPATIRGRFYSFSNNDRSGRTFWLRCVQRHPKLNFRARTDTFFGTSTTIHAVSSPAQRGTRTLTTTTHARLSAQGMRATIPVTPRLPPGGYHYRGRRTHL